MAEPRAGSGSSSNIQPMTDPYETVTAVPEGWCEMTALPRSKYLVIEFDDGWRVYADDSDHGSFT